MLLTIGLALMLSQAPPAEPTFPERLKAAGSRDVLDVPAATLLIEEKSLPADIGRSEVDIPLPRGGMSLTDMADRGQRGMRLLAFTLNPKELLTVKMAGQDPGKIQLSLAPPMQAGPMSGEIGMVNKKPVFQRTRNLQIRNITDQPFTVLLRVTGLLGYPYKLEIKRGE